MDAALFSLLLVAFIHVALAAMLALRLARRFRAHRIDEKKAKAIHSWLCLPIGLLFGAAIYPGVITVFRIPVGHGEALVAAFMLHLLIACAMIPVGWIIIGWEPVRW